MTIQDAKIIELACDRIFSDSLEAGIDCLVSQNGVGALKIAFGRNYICISSKDLQTPTYISFNGYYEDLQGYINKIQLAIKQNQPLIELLMESYNTTLED